MALPLRQNVGENWMIDGCGFIRKKGGYGFAVAIPATSKLALSCCTHQQNALEFLHPPSRHRQLMMVTSLSSKICFAMRRVKMMDSSRTRGVSPCNVTHLWGDGVSNMGIEMIAMKGKIPVKKECGWHEVPLSYRRTSWLESVAGVSPTPVTVS